MFVSVLYPPWADPHFTHGDLERLNSFAFSLKKLCPAAKCNLQFVFEGGIAAHFTPIIPFFSNHFEGRLAFVHFTPIIPFYLPYTIIPFLRRRDCYYTLYAHCTFLLEEFLSLNIFVAQKIRHQLQNLSNSHSKIFRCRIEGWGASLNYLNIGEPPSANPRFGIS